MRTNELFKVHELVSYMPMYSMSERHQWPFTSAQLRKGALRTHDLSQTEDAAWPGNSLLDLSSPAHPQSGWVSPLFFLLRCIPYASSARISHRRSFWAWVTTSGLCSLSTTAVSAPTSTSVYRGRTALTTGPRSFSTEVSEYRGPWNNAQARGPSFSLGLSPVVRSLIVKSLPHPLARCLSVSKFCMSYIDEG